MELKDATQLFKIRITLQPRVSIPGLSAQVRHYPHPNDSLDFCDWRKNWAKRTGQLIERLTII